MPSTILGDKRSSDEQNMQCLCFYKVYILVEETDKRPVMKLVKNILLGSGECCEDVNKG